MEIPVVTSAPAGAFLLDVREDDEWVAGHAPQAVHIPLGQLARRLDEVPRDRQVVAICHSGVRSAQATAFLRVQGIDAANFAGGMLAWAASGAAMQSGTGAPPVVY